MPRASVRLERPVKVAPRNKPLHVDIWVEQGDMVLSLELKYKTSSLKSLEKGETFDLQNHSAQDIGRYDFVKDLWRLENIVANSEHVIGYAVMLTNDPSYWIQSRNALTVDRDFRLHEGRELHGTLH